MTTIPLPNPEIPKRRRNPFSAGRYRKAEEKVSFNHTHSITGIDYKMYTSPVVYVWKRSGEWLYVGCSHAGMTRILDSSHHILGKEIRDTDEILMMYNLTNKQAAALEVELIKAYKPRYNKSLAPNKSYMRQIIRKSPEAPVSRVLKKWTVT